MGECVPLTWCLRMRWLPVRGALALLVMLGLINVFMVRVNLSVAIVAMVRRPNTTTSTHGDPQCAIPSTTSTTTANTTTANTTTTYAGELSLSTVAGESPDSEVEDVSPALLVDAEKGGMEEEEEEEELLLDWDEWVQGLVLGSFFYGYWISQVIGGRLAEVFGTKLVLGVTVLSGGVAALLTPVAARAHYAALITLRTLQGLLQGAAFPCIFPLMVRWIPRFERAKFIAYILFCNNISITFTMAMCGLVINAFGWEAAFYVTGVSSLVWCLLWYTCMYETPQEHPRITPEELNYILESKEVDPEASGSTSPVPSQSSSLASSSVPWWSVAGSLPVWAIMVCEAGNSFGYSVYFSYMPTYVQAVLGVPISENGLLSALPFLARYLGGVVFATFGEWLLVRGYLTVLAVRRIFSAVAMLGPAATLLAVAQVGCVPADMAVLLLCLGFFFNGAITVGLFANKADITINYSGTVCGLGNTCANMVSFIVPLIVGAITQEEQTVEQWRKVFWVCVPVYVACEGFFFAFASGTRQPWDLPRGRQKGREMKEEEEEEEETDEMLEKKRSKVEDEGSVEARRREKTVTVEGNEEGRKEGRLEEERNIAV